MTAFRNYNGIGIEVALHSEVDGDQWEIPITRAEGWTHISLKASIAVHLRYWGYIKSDIVFEYVPTGNISHYRADVFAIGNGELPNFWFECLFVRNEKLVDLTQSMPGCRVVHVVDTDLFRKLWNDQIFDDDMNEIAEPTLDDIRRQRMKELPSGTEIWAINSELPAGYITFGVKRDLSGELTYFDTMEGYSILDFKDFKIRTAKIEALIPTIAGSADWNGMSRRT